MRLIDIEHGSITIGGIDIATTASSEMANLIAALPQDSFAPHQSTAREYMNSSGTFSDPEIVCSLQRVNLWDCLVDKGGLDATLSDGLLSRGQMQLLCFARLILREHSKILVLDEPSSR